MDRNWPFCVHFSSLLSLSGHSHGCCDHNSPLPGIWQNGKTVLLDIDVKGGLKIKSIFKKKALSIFVKPPSIKSLDNRLTKRALDTQKSIQERLKKSEFELDYADKFDVILENKDLDKTKIEAFRIVSEFIDSK